MICPNHEDQERIISQSVGVCSECLRNGVQSLAPYTHSSLRKRDNLIPVIPAGGNYTCGDCGNHCNMNEGEIGFCHNRIATEKGVVERYPGRAVVSWYFDPLPTNCVADWVCRVNKEREWGIGQKRLKNLAVFYGSCNSDCLFCQNASYRTMMAHGKPLMTPRELANAADEFTTCVCFFGGDPSASSKHSLETSVLLNEDRLVRVCYETNGNISKKWLGKIAEVIETTGGTFKFDLKAVTPQIYKAITGVDNTVVLNNFKELAISRRDREGEFLVASVLLIPGYIDIPEVRTVCSFIAECDPTIPTVLLGFYPHHAMRDLPRTSISHAKAALETAKGEGLSNVRIGNIGLLGQDMYGFD
jgi:pyruvate formate lyase activating enzyme